MVSGGAGRCEGVGNVAVVENVLFISTRATDNLYVYLINFNVGTRSTVFLRVNIDSL